MHEIGHILGFVSGVDDPGWLTAVVDNQNNGTKIDGKKLKFTTVLDMFRYSSSSTAQGRIDLSINGDNKYFSIDGGYTNLANFATGKETSLGSDGEQASHWKHQDNPLGIMDPILNAGQRRQISNLDKKAMDVMGWDVTYSGQLDWQALYNRSVTEAQTAMIASRDGDVQAMVERSQVYEWGTSGRRWQKGFWQHILDQEIDSSATASETQPILTSSVGLRLEVLGQENRAIERSNYDNLIEEEIVNEDSNQNNELPKNDVSESQLVYSQDEQNDLVWKLSSDGDLLLLDNSIDKELEKLLGDQI